MLNRYIFDNVVILWILHFVYSPMAALLLYFCLNFFFFIVESKFLARILKLCFLTVMSPYLVEVLSDTPSECLKPQIVLNPIYTMFSPICAYLWYSSAVKYLSAMQMWVWSMGREDPLDDEMATHSNILAWEIPWTEEPGGLESMGLQRIGCVL